MENLILKIKKIKKAAYKFLFQFLLSTTIFFKIKKPSDFESQFNREEMTAFNFNNILSDSGQAGMTN